EEEKLSVRWIESGMRDLSLLKEFDGALCFGNSLGYDDDEGNAAFLVARCRSLAPGARLILDYPPVLECRVPRFQSRNWGPFGDIYFLEDEQYDPSSGRIVTEYTFIRNGDTVKPRASLRCYPFRKI